MEPDLFLVYANGLPIGGKLEIRKEQKENGKNQREGKLECWRRNTQGKREEAKERTRKDNGVKESKEGVKFGLTLLNSAIVALRSSNSLESFNSKCTKDIFDKVLTDFMA